jgi:hypothetical protein
MDLPYLLEPTDSPALDQTRQFVLLPVGVRKALSVEGVGVGGSPGEAVGLGDHPGRRTTFVPVLTGEGSPRYLLKTGTIVVGGESLCLQLTLAALTAENCDARIEGQRWSISRARDAEGHATWRISTDAERLMLGSETYFLADRGPARIPSLD